MKLKEKYTLIGAALVVAAVFNGGLFYRDFAVLNEQTKQMLTVDNVRLFQMQADMMHDAIRADIGEITDAVQKKDATLYKASVDGMHEHFTKLNATMDGIKQLDLPPTLKEQVTTVVNQFAAYDKVANAVVAAGMDENNVFQAVKPFTDQFHILEKSQEDYEDTSGNWNEQLKKQQDETATSVGHTIIVLAIINILLALVLPVYAMRAIFKPLAAMSSAMRRLSQGDSSLTILYADRDDEMGEMAQSLQIFKDTSIAKQRLDSQSKEEVEKKLARQQRVDKLVNDFSATASRAVGTVSATAAELSTIATDMNRLATQTNQQAVDASTSSHQTSGAVQTVAAAIEEMSASVKEISSQVAKSSANVREAMDETKNANVISTEMLEAADSISAVTNLIENIAEQINLLALNATIESARAGEAGKGFAVVANEAKNLAGQTTKATEDIRLQLDNLGQMAKNVANALVKLSGSVEKVNETSGGIASAVEQQAAVTQEIASNMNSTASSVDQINTNIDGIQKSTQTTSSSTQHILSASEKLSKQAEELSQQVRHFLESIKAA